MYVCMYACTLISKISPYEPNLPYVKTSDSGQMPCRRLPDNRHIRQEMIESVSGAVFTTSATRLRPRVDPKGASSVNASFV